MWVGERLKIGGRLLALRVCRDAAELKNAGSADQSAQPYENPVT